MRGRGQGPATHGKFRRRFPIYTFDFDWIRARETDRKRERERDREKGILKTRRQNFRDIVLFALFSFP